MSWFTSIGPGDWVSATSTIPITLSDHVTGDGIRSGTRGVVTAVTGSQVTVDFDSGWGLHTATVSSRDLRRIRAGGGVERFRSRARTTTLIRLGLAIALLFPIVLFVADYLWTFHTLDGIVPAFLTTALDSVGDWIGAAVAHPMHTLVFGVVIGLVSRWVFRR